MDLTMFYYPWSHDPTGRMFPRSNAIDSDWYFSQSHWPMCHLSCLSQPSPDVCLLARFSHPSSHLCCTVLYCTVLHYAVLYLLFSNLLKCNVIYCTVIYTILQYSTSLSLQCCTVLYCVPLTDWLITTCLIADTVHSPTVGLSES